MYHHTESFDLDKYIGAPWYQLMGYLQPFQTPLDYNTTATYSLNPDGSVKVHNTTITKGEVRSATGRAVPTSIPGEFCVTFGFFPCFSKHPNYVIESIWRDENGNYVAAVVTDSKRNSLYVLSRTRFPPISMYDMLIKYVHDNFNAKKVIHTPHYTD